ncbi:MAG TPA: hypothetical protein PKK43_05365, partial [Spirochaetota bacterium]|nr:hypothetical protein [Spirochaetota bacterium]
MKGKHFLNAVGKTLIAGVLLLAGACGGGGGSSSGNGGSTPNSSVEDIALTLGSWLDSSIQDDESKWFYIDGEAGATYNLYLNDSSEGDGLKNGDVSVNFYHADKSNSYNFFSTDKCYLEPLTVTMTSSERLYVNVSENGLFSSGAGSFAIKIVKSSTTTEPITVNGAWTEGKIEAGDKKWYYFDASANTDYRFFLNNAIEGDNTYTGKVTISVYHADQTTAFSFSDNESAYVSPLKVSVGGA